MASPATRRAEPMFIRALWALVLAVVSLFVGIFTPGTTLIWLSIAATLMSVALLAIGLLRLAAPDRGPVPLPPPPPPRP